ncbi:MAG: hypothetical protein ACTSXQ_05600 [Alphaproteobacteria bacterium]
MSYYAQIMAAEIMREADRLMEETQKYRAEKNKPLDVKIHEWYSQLPAHDKKEYYTMEELKARFPVAPSRIGTALHELGWQRKRNWKSSGSHGRYWIPPENQ